jgi:hypothetical protein
VRTVFHTAFALCDEGAALRFNAVSLLARSKLRVEGSVQLVEAFVRADALQRVRALAVDSDPAFRDKRVVPLAESLWHHVQNILFKTQKRPEAALVEDESDSRLLLRRSGPMQIELVLQRALSLPVRVFDNKHSLPDPLPLEARRQQFSNGLHRCEPQRLALVDRTTGIVQSEHKLFRCLVTNLDLKPCLAPIGRYLKGHGVEVVVHAPIFGLRLLSTLEPVHHIARACPVQRLVDARVACEHIVRRCANKHKKQVARLNELLVVNVEALRPVHGGTPMALVSDHHVEYGWLAIFEVLGLLQHLAFEEFKGPAVDAFVVTVRARTA